MQTIIDCFKRRNGNLFGGKEKYSWCKTEDGNKGKLLYAKQLQSLSKVCSGFARVEIFTSCTVDQVIDSFLTIWREVFQHRKY